MHLVSSEPDLEGKTTVSGSSGGTLSIANKSSVSVAGLDVVAQAERAVFPKQQDPPEAAALAGWLTLLCEAGVCLGQFGMHRTSDVRPDDVGRFLVEPKIIVGRIAGPTRGLEAKLPPHQTDR